VVALLLINTGSDMAEQTSHSFLAEPKNQHQKATAKINKNRLSQNRFHFLL